MMDLEFPWLGLQTLQIILPMAEPTRLTRMRSHLLPPGSWPTCPVAHICLILANVGPSPSASAPQASSGNAGKRIPTE